MSDATGSRAAKGDLASRIDAELPKRLTPEADLYVDAADGGPHPTPDRAAETYVGDFIGSQRTHIIRVGFDPRPGWGRAVCGAKGHIPEAKDTPVVTCIRCFAWAKKNRPENVG